MLLNFKDFKPRGPPSLPAVGTEAVPSSAPDRIGSGQDAATPHPALPRSRSVVNALAPPAVPALALLCLDLGGYDAVVRVHGQPTGEEVLRVVAARLMREVRAEDTVSRRRDGGFVCAVAGFPGQAPLIQLACKLFDAVAAPLQIGGLRLTMAPSIGVAMGPHGGADVDALLRQAETAMRRATRDKTGYALFDERADAPVDEPAPIANSPRHRDLAFRPTGDMPCT